MYLLSMEKQMVHLYPIDTFECLVAYLIFSCFLKNVWRT